MPYIPLKYLLNTSQTPPEYRPDTPGIAVKSKTCEITIFDVFECFEFVEFSFSHFLALGEGFAYFGLQIRILRKKLYI